MKKKLQLTEKDYRYLFENSSDAMWVHDMEGNFVDANKAFARLSAGTLEEWSKIKVKEHMTKETLELSREVKRKLLNGEEFEQPYAQRFTTKDGRIRLYQVSTSPVIIDGEVRGFQHVGRDVTEEKYAEKMLENIIDGSPVPMFVIDRQHLITHWNKAIELLTGIKRAKITGTDKHWTPFYKKKRVTMADLVVDGASEEEINRVYHGRCWPSRLMNDTLESEAYFPEAGETGKWLLFNACPIKNEYGVTVGAIETMEDITEQKRLEENIRYYSQLVLRAQEDERKRIARELHDDTGSSILLLIRRLDALETSCPEVSEPVRWHLEKLRTQAVDVLEGLRRCAQELRPRILDDLGLVAAIEWIIDDIESTDSIETEVKVTGEEYATDSETQLMVFRIAQEALNNARRHSRATKISVEIDFTPEAISIVITDNGVGFSLPERIDELASLGHLGIMGMSERAQLMHGSLDISSEPGKGTVVSFRIPGNVA